MKRFETVELNNSFYRLPKNSAWKSWREAAADDFVYAVKASRYITHTLRLKRPEGAIEKLMKGANGLGPRLGPVLFQLPPDFKRSADMVARLANFLECLDRRDKNVVEFRDESWFVDDTFELLEGAGVGFCVIDMPGVECPVRTTAGVLYVRFHGPTKRYGGSYSRPHLKTWAERIRDLAADVDHAYAYFNNDERGYAPANAATLRELLES